MKKGVLLFAFMLVFIQSCGLLTISVSEKRDSVPKTITLAEGVSLGATGAIEFFGLDFFPASFIIEANGKTIYIDPIMVEDGKPADYIFITHGHPDHLSLPDIMKLAGTNTVIICPRTVSPELSGYTVKEVKPGDILDLDGLKCEAVPEYNLKPVFLWIFPHPKEDLNTGYILDFGGVRVYHAGDTDLVPELKGLSNITVMLVPIDGDDLTMSTEDAASLVNLVKPVIAIPMHYEIGKTNAQKFAALIGNGIDVEVMQIND
jgi:L-ascorbate metabolism protein UlaG (beta-lactamase superfamily)